MHKPWLVAIGGGTGSGKSTLVEHLHSRLGDELVAILHTDAFFRPMMGVNFTNFHQSLSTYIRGFWSVGFNIEDILEPTVDDHRLALYPELDDERRVPNFIIYVL